LKKIKLAIFIGFVDYLIIIEKKFDFMQHFKKGKYL